MKTIQELKEEKIEFEKIKAKIFKKELTDYTKWLRQSNYLNVVTFSGLVNQYLSFVQSQNNEENDTCKHGDWIYGEKRKKLCGKSKCLHVENY